MGRLQYPGLFCMAPLSDGVGKRMEWDGMGWAS